MTQTNTPERPVVAVILAAGKGTRMRSTLPKVLHPIGNAPMLHHSMRAADTMSPDRVAVVVGHGGDKVAAAARTWRADVHVAEQTEQLGTGHAVLAARQVLDGFDGDLFVLFGDTPFIRSETLAAMATARADAKIVALGFDAADPSSYGRFVLGADNALEAIVEAKDATPEQLTIRTCNSGVMAGDCATMLSVLDRVGNQNAQGEYYLTDVIGLARADGLPCRAVLCPEGETLGINDRVQLADAETIFQNRARREAMLAGATLTAPDTVFFSLDTHLGQDVTVQPNVVFGPGVEVADGCTVKSFCHLEDTRLAPDVQIGPFSRSRGGTDLASGVRVGNFVEMKKARLGKGTKAGHLSYLGDANLGDDVNIGAGTITCNYNGVEKSVTTIEDGAFIGVNTALVAPVTVGKGAFISTGTVVTKPIPDDAFAIARVDPTIREKFATRLMAIFRARKQKRQAEGQK